MGLSFFLMQKEFFFFLTNIKNQISESLEYSPLANGYGRSTIQHTTLEVALFYFLFIVKLLNSFYFSSNPYKNRELENRETDPISLVKGNGSFHLIALIYFKIRSTEPLPTFILHLGICFDYRFRSENKACHLKRHGYLKKTQQHIKKKGKRISKRCPSFCLLCFDFNVIILCARLFICYHYIIK